MPEPSFLPVNPSPILADNRSVSAETLRLRRMKESDIARMMVIESVSFGRFFWSPDSFRQELSNHVGRYYVLETTDNYWHDGLLLGYMGYWLVVDEVHVTTLAVHPDWRGQALGELLLAKVMEQAMCHSADLVTLEVRASNTIAQRLYVKYGFQLMGVRRHYYLDNHEDAHVMTSPPLLTPGYRALFREQTQKLFKRLGGIPEGFTGP